MPAWQKRQPWVQDLEAGAVVDLADPGHDVADREVLLPELVGDPLADLRRPLHRQDAPVRQGLEGVEGGDVDAFELREGPQAGRPALHPVEHRADLHHHVLAVADDEEVHEGGEGLRVEDGRPPREGQGVLLPPVLGPQGHAGEVDDVEDVGEGQLALQREADAVEGGEGVLALQAEEGQAQLAQQGLEVEAGGVDPLGLGPGELVDHVVEDVQAEVAEPEVVEVGKAQHRRTRASCLAERGTALTSLPR
jgi:hypothetical protein